MKLFQNYFSLRRDVRPK